MSDDIADPVLDAALKYAARGLYVFPVRLGVRGNGKKDVRPIDDWDSASSADPTVITGWFTNGWKGAALAVDTGKSGLVVADQDVSDGKRGPENWEILGERSEFRVRTPTGGLHDWYRADPERPVTVANRGEVADGVDVRGQGGFVFAPPTADPRGGSWEWELGEIPESFSDLENVPAVIPERLNTARSALRPKATPADPNASQLFASPSSIGMNGKRESDARRLLSEELEAFRALTEPGSGRSHILAQRLGVLAGHGAGVFWTYEDALDTLMKACADNGFSAEHGEVYARGQAARGVDYGMTELWTPLPEMVDETPVSTGRLRRAMYSRSSLRELPPPVPLIEGVLFERSAVVIAGKFGTYKTFVSVGMACSLVTGKDWFGHSIREPVPVIYAAAEGAYGINQRVDAWERAHGITVPDTFYLISLAARLTRPQDVAELKELIQETRARVIMFDTLHASTPGMDENDSGAAGEVFETLRELMHQHGVTVVLPHHTGHAGERSRGTSSIEDDADTSFVIKLGGDGEDRSAGTPRVMHHRKAKDSKTIEPIPLLLVEEGESAYVRARNAYEAVQGGEVAPEWVAPAISVPDMVEAVLSEHGHDRGLTKSDVHGMVVERYYGGQKARLLKQTWGGGWNRALQRESIVNVGGERFSADPLVIEKLSD